MAYARGKHAVGQCQRCGFKVAYLSLRRDGGTNLLVCSDCFDVEHPVERPVPTRDNIALYRPSPDLDAVASRGLASDAAFVDPPAFGDPYAGMWADPDWAGHDYAGD